MEMPTQGQISKIKQKFNSIQPAIFYVEVSLACNLRCPECAIGANLISRRRGFLSFEQYKIIADKIRPFAKRVFLFIWGEPLINKDILKMIRYTSEFAESNISTNGNMIDEEMAEQLILAGTKNIWVSVDGYTQDMYEKYRIGGQVDKVFQGIEHLVRFKEKHESDINIFGQFIVFKHNQHQAGPFKRKCESLGIVPRFITAIFIRSDLEGSTLPRFRRIKAAAMADVKRVTVGCELRNRMSILLDGTVVPCCFDYNKEMDFGNIFIQDVDEIWNGEDYRRHRLDVITGDVPEFCYRMCLRFTRHPNLKNEHPDARSQVHLEETHGSRLEVARIRHGGKVPEKKQEPKLVQPKTERQLRRERRAKYQKGKRPLPRK